MVATGSGHRTHAAARRYPVWASPSDARGRRHRSRDHRPTPGWPGDQEPTAPSAGTAARGRSAPRRVRPTARRSDRRPADRRSPGCRDASASPDPRDRETRHPRPTADQPLLSASCPDSGRNPSVASIMAQPRATRGPSSVIERTSAAVGTWPVTTTTQADSTAWGGRSRDRRVAYRVIFGAVRLIPQVTGLIFSEQLSRNIARNWHTVTSCPKTYTLSVDLAEVQRWWASVS